MTSSTLLIHPVGEASAPFDLTDTEIGAARARGAALDGAEPRALSARYDPASGRIVVDLANGCELAFPARRVQGLAHAKDGDLADVEVTAAGRGLHWPTVDVDVTVPGLLAGLFGTKAWTARELARHAGRATSTAKAEAARENGRKGGRPRKPSAI